ncbi:MAG TPA: hypothetical protein VI818_04425, partial [Candidatus Thermoplasmatota archaeon]|nr:hypothetical protein [Candidatus Thermoplasmatota archaeon]
TVVFGMEAPPDLPTPPEAQAWGEEHATDAMRDLESRIPDLREAAAAWREAFDDGAELLAAVLVFRMEVGRAEGDVTSLAAALERCKAAASPSP